MPVSSPADARVRHQRGAVFVVLPDERRHDAVGTGISACNRQRCAQVVGGITEAHCLAVQFSRIVFHQNLEASALEALHIIMFHLRSQVAQLPAALLFYPDFDGLYR